MNGILSWKILKTGELDNDTFFNTVHYIDPVTGSETTYSKADYNIKKFFWINNGLNVTNINDNDSNLTFNITNPTVGTVSIPKQIIPEGNNILYISKFSLNGNEEKKKFQYKWW